MGKKGFTIVELLVSILVIAILATIAIVSYNGLTSNARDAARRTAAKDMQKMISMLKTKVNFDSYGTPSAAISNGVCPMPSAGAPWRSALWAPDRAFAGGCSIGDMLVAAGATNSEFWDKIPRNEEYSSNSRNTSQLVADCNGGIYLFYYVKNATAEETQFINNLSSKCNSRIRQVRDIYKMRAAILLETK